MKPAPSSGSRIASTLAQDEPRFARTSSGKYSAKREVLTYRAQFAETWQRFIRENFDSKEHAAAVFGVDASTAAKWWDGLHAPSGFVVGKAIRDDATRDAVLTALLSRAA